ncbi:MAG: hypothetical protein ACI4JC_02090, partial [Faecalibacterium sp.]
MNPITRNIRIDLANPGGMDFLSMVYAVRGDSGSRKICFELYSGGLKYSPPSGTTCQIAGMRPDGSVVPPYSSIPQEDGTTRTAYECSENLLTVELSDAILKKAGDISVTVEMRGENGAKLSTWPISCRIDQSAVSMAEEDPEIPSESASTAADRAEEAARQAAASAKVAGEKNSAAAGSAEAAAESQSAAASSAQTAAQKVEES